MVLLDHKPSIAIPKCVARSIENWLRRRDLNPPYWINYLHF
jgi:rRNA-processing protein FCF1